jgi:autotransporter-associated beta strand protein
VTWTGLSPDGDGNNLPANWLGNTLPLNDGTEEFIFGPAARSTVTFYTDVNARKISIVGNFMPYELDDDYGDLTIGVGGVVYAPAVPVKSILGSYTVILAGDQTWDIQNGELGFYYDLTGTGRLTKTGAGTLDMASSYSWTGGVTLNAGTLVLDNYNSTSWTLGSGSLIIGPPPVGLTPPPLLVARESIDSAYETSLTNPVELNGILATHNEAELNLAGAVTLNTDTTIKSTGEWLIITGAIADGPTGTPPPRKLTVDSNGTVILDGTNTYSGGTQVQNGMLIFANVGSLPAAPATNALTASANGYIGFGDDGTTNLGASLTNPQGLFLDRFNKAMMLGTVGFDSDPDLAATNYTGAINLSAAPTGTAFAPGARLGSATHAILSGTITPQGTATDPYRFGGGGGHLQVDSILTGARSLVVDSPAASPLTLRVTNEGNDYTGSTSVTNSALIFGTGSITSTFPTDGTRNITINAGGYVGFEFWDDLTEVSFVSQSLAKISTTSVGAVGYDNYSIVPAPIDLSLFTNALYIGTSTKGVEGPGLTISGLITPAGGGSAPYRFAGYKGGALKVESILSGARAVHIGDPTSPATFGDFFSETYSTVALTGNNNTLTGPVMLYGGQLVVGQSNGVVGTDATNALGSGTLEVAGMPLPPEWQRGDEEAPAPQLGTITDGLIIPNNVNLTADLNIAEYSDFTLAGKISGAGELYLESGDYLTRTKLTLGSDTNDFTGGIYLSGYSHLEVGANHATGTGPLGFGYSSVAEVYFKTLNPVIGGLMSKEYGDSATLYAEQTDTVLTINQSFDSKFNGYFRSNGPYPADNFRIVKSGAGTLYLGQGGLYFYHGKTEATLPGTPEVSLQINQGRVVIGDNFYLESPTPTIWVHGGTLALARNMNYYTPLNNPLVVDNGGRLAGTGHFASSVAIGTGAILSPGMDGAGPIGLLAFDHLELNSGGVYEWNIQDPNAPFGHDQIDVNTPTTLVINATADNPLTVTADERFTLKVISLTPAGTPGLLAGFNPTIGYSWSLISYEAISLSAGFASAKFNLDTSGFANSLVGGPQGKGAFYLTDTGSQIMLNFAPVPEPSTYALLLVGLGAIALQLRRRRVN